MSDYTETLKLIKQAALDAVNATKPTTICFGTVASVSPLTINVEQKMTLGEKQLVLSRNVTDHMTMVTVNWSTESSLNSHSHSVAVTTEPDGDPTHTHAASGSAAGTSLTHAHKISGKKEITIHNGLVVGDEVILMQMQGGQKFLVWDRVGT